MKIIASEALSRGGLARLIGMRYRGKGTIFALHSVVENTGDYLHQPLRCSLECLERAVRWAKSRDLDIVTLDEAIKRLGTRGSRRFVVFTFDDGYRDNITRVLPVMEKYNAPYTIFVATHMITRELDGWWLGLVPLLRDNSRIEIAAMNKAYKLDTFEEKKTAFKEIGRWISQNGERTGLLDRTFAAYGVDMQKLLDEEAMTMDELRSAAAHRLVTIGAHTTSHCFLNQETADRVREEIADNKLFLENATGRSIDYFAYPYGAAGAREAEIVKELGFKAAVTTNAGTLFPEHAGETELFGLPREPIDQSDTRGCLDCREQGVYRFIRSRGGSPIAHMRH